MKTKFHILKSSGVLTASIYDQLRVILDETDKECRQIIDLGDVDVVIMNVPWNVIPRIGINGFAYDAHQIILTLDCAHEYLSKNFEQTVKAILCHELHHSARSLARGSSHSKIYGGSLIAEGLACCFEEEIVGEVPFYATECQGHDLSNFAKKAKEQVFTPRENLPGDWRSWMFGSYNNSDFPYQCGYSTGYALLRCWLDENNLTASAAVAVDENEVLSSWLDGRINPFG